MSLNYIQHKFLSSIISVLLVMAFAFAGCTDELPYTPVEIPDADVELRGEVIFKPLVSTEVKTRGEAPAGAAYEKIETLGIYFFDKDENIISNISGKVEFEEQQSEGSTHKHVVFKKRLPAGEYYIFAVVNVPEASLSDVKTITDLRNFKLEWDDDITKDLEMFGVFKSTHTEDAPDNDSFEADILIPVTPENNIIYSWVRRATAKVTIDFDGSELLPGVIVQIESATLKDVASGALLGAVSKVGENDFTCKESSYTVSYSSDEGLVTNATKPASPSPFHVESAKALPCYENMQGTREGKPKLQDKNNDGIIDSQTKDGVDNGTYLEVKGHYKADRQEYKSEGDIIYRFMLGKNAENDFDVMRNHHYKITMCFKGYGSDIDWHIVYVEKYIDATYPQDVNYKGEFFTPDTNVGDPIYNAGHEFGTNNVITVTSYTNDGSNNTWLEPDEICYTWYTHNDNNESNPWTMTAQTTQTEAGSGGWLTLREGGLSADNTHKDYTFVADISDATTSAVTFPTATKGGETPYNLSNSKGESTIQNTANCYIVDAGGYYSFPLIYGNAISEGKNPNSDAYNSSNFKNYLNQNITQDSIKADIPAGHKLTPKLIWQDAESLIDPATIKYDADLFDGKGGITFQIGTIQEGNAVIALIDEDADEDEDVRFQRNTIAGGNIYGLSGSTKAVWSWHIWATRFNSDDYEKEIRILNQSEKPYDLMPVNLGWCSGGKNIVYHKRRKCDITFKFGDQTIVRTIEQYPHIVLPRGDHPYYQWGRKDPFVGTNISGGNKERWLHDGTKYEVWSQYNPPRLYNEPEKETEPGSGKYIRDWHNDKRHKTIECLNVLIKNPDKWHNANREPKDGIDPDNSNPDLNGFKSLNESFYDLWSISGKKTIYDPCPPGYQVGDSEMFTGFIYFRPYDIGDSRFWYDVLEKNMAKNYYEGEINSQVRELYTDTRKIQSITFPVTGYRDYDDRAAVTTYPNGSDPGIIYVWTNTATDATNSIHLDFRRNNLTEGKPWESRGGSMNTQKSYFNCDGFAVRPVKIK